MRRARCMGEPAKVLGLPLPEITLAPSCPGTSVPRPGLSRAATGPPSHPGSPSRFVLVSANRRWTWCGATGCAAPAWLRPRSPTVSTRVGRKQGGCRELRSAAAITDPPQAAPRHSPATAGQDERVEPFPWATRPPRTLFMRGARPLASGPGPETSRGPMVTAPWHQRPRGGYAPDHGARRVRPARNPSSASAPITQRIFQPALTEPDRVPEIFDCPMRRR